MTEEELDEAIERWQNMNAGMQATEYINLLEKVEELKAWRDEEIRLLQLKLECHKVERKQIAEAAGNPFPTEKLVTAVRQWKTERDEFSREVMLLRAENKTLEKEVDRLLAEMRQR